MELDDYGWFWLRLFIGGSLESTYLLEVQEMNTSEPHFRREPTCKALPDSSRKGFIVCLCIRHPFIDRALAVAVVLRFITFQHLGGLFNRLIHFPGCLLFRACGGA
jgi:hypothetical protein